MSEEFPARTGPVEERERVGELDVLRGVALLGVLLMNFTAFANADVIATKTQLSALGTAPVDDILYFATRWLVGDKANTMFATLFGLGFYLQMKRSEGRPGFEARYAKRLFWLLVFGWLNMTLLWIWDILNVYALAGFFLLAMRKWRTRTLVIFGLALALYSDHLQELLTGAINVQLIPDSLYAESAVLARQQVAINGSYLQAIAMTWQWTWIEWFSGGLLFAWLIYALGRFALGAAIGRSGILDDVTRYLPLLRRVMRIALLAGLVFALIVRLMILSENETVAQAGEALRSPAALLLAAGYSAGIVVALHHPFGRRIFTRFAPVGRMALTNYLVQGFLYGLVLFGVGPGLGLAGRIGTSVVIPICLAFFGLQMAFSHWWLTRYRFGPMEWLWRTLTYGERPKFRRTALVPA